MSLSGKRGDAHPEQQNRAIVNLESAAPGSGARELAASGQETTWRTPGDVLVKREGRNGLKVHSVDLRDVQCRHWESGRNSNGVSRCPELKGRVSSAEASQAVLDTQLFCSVSLRVRSASRHNPLEIIMTENLKNKCVLDGEMFDGNFRTRFRSRL